jgi:hypothetical protein
MASTPAVVPVPRVSSSREQARSILEALPPDLSGNSIQIDCNELAVGTPSFLDEVVKIILVERHADRLRLMNAPGRVAEHAKRAAAKHEVSDRLEIRAQDQAMIPLAYLLPSGTNQNLTLDLSGFAPEKNRSATSASG